MSDNKPVIINGIGTPRVWLFTNNDIELCDFDGIPISKYLTEFEYIYDEENDDEATMKFLFPTLESFDLPYCRR